MSQVAALDDLVASWRPDELRVTGRIDEWSCQALAALLDVTAPSRGEALPILWHEVFLHPPLSPVGLAEDGHPVGGLLPPLPERRRMFGGGSVEVRSPLHVGEEVTRISRVAGVRVREGRSGRLLIVTEEHDFVSVGRLRLRDRREILYRQGMPEAPGGAGARPAGTRPDDQMPQPAATMTIGTDPRILFLYSALTYNAHRIHYDHRYAVEVAGHDGLLVHGPLIATGCAEVATRLLGGLSEFEYRLVAPAIAGPPVSFHAAPPAGGACPVWATQEGRVCARGVATRTRVSEAPFD